MTIPKRHHYVPQMILNGFTDPGGWLHWCRHHEDPSAVRPARAAELFHKNHLYSTLSDSGIKDPAMERFLSVLEGEAVGVVKSILSQARSGVAPAMSREQKLVWNMFFLMQWRRTPETQRANTSDAEAIRMVEEIIANVRAAAPHRDAELDRLATPQAMARIVRNVRVQTLIQFSGEVMSVLERRGIAVLHIARPNKSSTVGSRPVVKLTSPGRTDLNDPLVEMWMPIASDVAVGVGRGDGGVSLHSVDEGSTVRQLNLSIAKQSGTIAAGSAALVRSIANAR